MDGTNSICAWCGKYYPTIQLRDHQFECELELSRDRSKSKENKIQKKKIFDQGDRLGPILEDMSSHREIYSTLNECNKCGIQFQNLHLLSNHSLLCDLKVTNSYHTDSNSQEIISISKNNRYQTCALCNAQISIDEVATHSSECFDEILLKRKRERPKKKRVTVISDGEEIPLFTKKMKNHIIIGKKTCPTCKSQFEADVFEKHVSLCNSPEYLERTYMRKISQDQSPTYMIADFERRKCIICDKLCFDSESKLMHDQDCINSFLFANKDLFNRSEDSVVMKSLQHILMFIQRSPIYMPNGIRVTARLVMCSVFCTEIDIQGIRYNISENRISGIFDAISWMKQNGLEQQVRMLDQKIHDGDYFLACMYIDSISMMIMDTKEKLDYLYVINKSRSIRNNILNALWYNMERKISGDPYIIFNMLEICLIERNTFLLYEVIIHSLLFSYDRMDDTISSLCIDYKYLYRLVSFCPKIQEKYKQAPNVKADF